MVECDLAKVEVAGSNPVSRSKNQQSAARGQSLRLVADHWALITRPVHCPMIAWVDIFRPGSYFNIRQGAVPKW